jgi:regulator of protease activity HflC (stomatin/prohibitin superfamily)
MFWITVVVFVFVVSGLIIKGLRRVPADPPHKAVVTRFGKRTGEVWDEGWHFFFLYPWITGAVLVNMTKKNQDLTPRDVRTPDMAEIEIMVSLTFQPEPQKLIEYLNSGGESGVKSILEDIVEETVREFAANPNQSPYTWEDAIKMKREFLAQIVLAVTGKDPATLTPTEIDEMARELRRGNGKTNIETLGIVLNRVNVTNIRPKGKLAEAAEQVAKEKRERDGEVVELEHVAKQTEILAAKYVTLGATPEAAFERALETVQTERKKISKDLKEIKLSRETTNAILSALSTLAPRR